jgi:hypothetical protein
MQYIRLLYIYVTVKSLNCHNNDALVRTWNRRADVTLLQK